MTTFNVNSSLEPKVQFERGFTIDDREGRYNAPATAMDDGTLVKIDSLGTGLAVCGTADAQFILEEPCTTDGPTGSAANREKYLQGLPQKGVKVATPIAAYPIKPGAIIKTTKYVSGTLTGALTAMSVTIGTTLLESYVGEWRIRQSSNRVQGEVIGFDATAGWVRILLRDGVL